MQDNFHKRRLEANEMWLFRRTLAYHGRVTWSIKTFEGKWKRNRTLLLEIRRRLLKFLGLNECLVDITGYIEVKRIEWGGASYLLKDLLYIDDKSKTVRKCGHNYIAADVEFCN